MSAADFLIILAAGLAAGTINTVVGSGSLITFPVLLAFGYAPVTANVSNNIGLVPGAVSGSVGYRRELRGQRERAIWLGRASLLGGTLGAVLLLALPASWFAAIVPVFIAIALVLVVLQPRLAAVLARRHEEPHEHGGRLALAGVFGAGVYGGYFGAAQGILLLAILGLTVDDDLQRINGLKNVLAVIVNGVAAVVFVLARRRVGAGRAHRRRIVLGGQIGARYGRRLPRALRAVIVVVGLTAIAHLARRCRGNGALAHTTSDTLCERTEATQSTGLQDQRVPPAGIEPATRWSSEAALDPLSYEGIVPICRGFSLAIARTRIPESCGKVAKFAGNALARPFLGWQR